MPKPKILFSIPTRHHVEIATDERDGLQELGYTCASFPYAAKEGVSSKVGRLWVILKNALTLVKTAHSFQPDIIYFNSRIESLAGFRDYLTIRLVKLLYRKKVKFVIKSHGSDLVVFSNGGRLTRIVLAYLKNNISAWIFLSNEEKAIASQKRYLPANRTFVTKNIVRADHFIIDPNFKARFNIPEDCTILLFVGRLISEKGIFEVVDAFAQVSNRDKFRVLVVGWGPEEQAVKNRCEELSISYLITFTGFIPEAEVGTFYANCDILVFPTYFPEGFPMALFNSVAGGMGIITTKIRAAADFLTQTDNCLWVEPQDSLDVANAINLLGTSPQVLSLMKANNKMLGKVFGKQQVAIELSGMLNRIYQAQLP